MFNNTDNACLSTLVSSLKNYNLEVKILSLVYVQLYYINNDINRQKYFSKSEQNAVLYFIFVSENTCILSFVCIGENYMIQYFYSHSVTNWIQHG